MDDAIRELRKLLDVLEVVDLCFAAEAQMNATKHMATTVRPTPLAAAVAAAVENGRLVIKTLENR